MWGDRFAFDDAVSREISRAGRTRSALSLLVLEVDESQAVDEALVGVVEGTIAAQVREPDLCFRWEGRRFVLLLPDTSRWGAMEMARRVRGVCAASHHLPGGQPLRLTAGIAQLDADQDGAALLEAADSDLARAKQAAAGPAPERRSGGAP